MKLLDGTESYSDRRFNKNVLKQREAHHICTAHAHEFIVYMLKDTYNAAKRSVNNTQAIQHLTHFYHSINIFIIGSYLPFQRGKSIVEIATPIHQTLQTRLEQRLNLYKSAKTSAKLLEWTDHTFDLLEYLYQYWAAHPFLITNRVLLVYFNKFTVDFNTYAEHFNLKYRFKDGKFIAITDPMDLEEIEKIENITQNSTKSITLRHREKAINFFSKRPEPDYENAIKECIVMLEVYLKAVTGEKKATLRDLIAALKDKVPLETRAFLAGIQADYGPTNDHGARHGGVFGGYTLTEADARYLIVRCCSFINWCEATLPKTNGQPKD